MPVTAIPSLSDLCTNVSAKRFSRRGTQGRHDDGLARPLLICRNLATLCPRLWEKTNPLSHRTWSSKASSVPGSKQTATFGSSTEAKPRVEVPDSNSSRSYSPPSESLMAVHQLGTEASSGAHTALPIFDYTSHPRIDLPGGMGILAGMVIAGPGRSGNQRPLAQFLTKTGPRASPRSGPRRH